MLNWSSQASQNPQFPAPFTLKPPDSRPPTPENSTSKTINIYFGGTWQPHPEAVEEPLESVWAYFHENDASIDACADFVWENPSTINPSLEPPPPLSQTIKIAFPGPAGILGALFGTGVESTAQFVAKKIRAILHSYPALNITLNMMGFSRGAATALLVLKKLKDQDPDRLQSHIALMDPVPGNLITSHKINTSFFGKTLRQKILDLFDCHILKDVLMLHSQHQGLVSEKRPAWAMFSNPFFSPITPTWPPACAVEEDVISGDHSAVEVSHIAGRTQSVRMNPVFPTKNQIYQRCYEFLKKHGYTHKAPPPKDEFINSEELRRYYENQNLHYDFQSTRKACHSPQSQPAAILASQQTYYNLHHKSLDLQLPVTELTSEDCSLKVARVELRKNPPTSTTTLTFNPALFKDFCYNMRIKMTISSRRSRKGELLQRCQLMPLINQDDLARALVAVFGVVLQRDRWTPYTFTHSSEAAIILLNQPKYNCLKRFILSALNTNPFAPATYQHLQAYALTSNHNAYFNSQNREVAYHAVEKLISK